MASKPKQVRLSLQQKVTVLNKLDQGVRANRLAKDFCVSESAISQIKSKRSEILAAVSNTCQEVKKKTLHKEEYPQLEEKLYEWFQKQRDRNCPINGPLLKAKAKDIFKTLFPEKDEKAFEASEGWLWKFKRRRGIRFLKVCGEILSSDSTAITPFVHRFRSKVNEMELTNNQIYNAKTSRPTISLHFFRKIVISAHISFHFVRVRTHDIAARKSSLYRLHQRDE